MSAVVALVVVNVWPIVSHWSQLEHTLICVNLSGSMTLSDDTLSALVERQVQKQVERVQQQVESVQQQVEQSLSDGADAMQRDFALKADGGIVACRLTSNCRSWSLGLIADTADLAISDNMQVGQCWMLPSRSGQLGVILSSPIVPSHVTIDHIPRAIAAEIGEAPRSMILWGVVDGAHNTAKLRDIVLPELPTQHPRLGPSLSAGYQYLPIAAFEYNISKRETAQTFRAFDYIWDTRVDFLIVVLEILDNWGAAETRLYRVKVHGEVVAEGH